MKRRVLPPSTSEADPLQVAWVDVLPARTLGITICPGRTDDGFAKAYRRNVAEDFRVLWRIGVRCVVNLVENDELERIVGEHAYMAAARHFRINVVRLPVRDNDVPADLAAFGRAARAVERRLNRGQHVVVHCRGGLGRSGMFAGVTLAPRYGAELVLDSLRRARGVDCPTTHEQVALVRAAETAPWRT